MTVLWIYELMGSAPDQIPKAVLMSQEYAKLLGGEIIFIIYLFGIILCAYSNFGNSMYHCLDGIFREANFVLCMASSTNFFPIILFTTKKVFIFNIVFPYHNFYLFLHCTQTYVVYYWIGNYGNYTK